MTKFYKKPVIATIIHISDLHFGDTFITNANILKKILSKTPLQGLSTHCYVSARSLSNRIKEILEDRKNAKVPAGVVFSGDLTSSGDVQQYQTGTTFLRGKQWTGANKKVGLGLGPNQQRVTRRSSPALFSIPGNHDIWKRRNPSILSRYLSYFPGNFPITWEIKTKSKDVFLHGVNSTEVGKLGQKLARGRISAEQLDDLENKIVSLKKHNNDSIHIVFLHHPIVAAGKKWDPSKELDEHAKIARRLAKISDLVLSGHVHKHEYYIKKSGLPYHAIAGTATQMFSKRDFQVIDISDDRIRIQVFGFDDSFDTFIPDTGRSYSFHI